MGKTGTTGIPSLKPQASCPPARDAVLEPNWADAETRAFLAYPYRQTQFAKVLRVILVTAMAAAAVKIAWILAVHV